MIHRPWTQPEIDLLIECTKLGFNSAKLAPIFDRTQEALGAKRRYLRALLRQPPKKVAPEVQPRPVAPIHDIQRIVAEHWPVSVEHMTSPSRLRDHTRPRQVAIYLSRRITRKSLPTLGQRFGNRDHTTILHAVRMIEKLRAEDADLAEKIETLEGKINEAVFFSQPTSARISEAA